MNTFHKIIQHFGSVKATAEALNVTYQAVCFWRDGERTPSPEICADIEKLTGGKFTRQQLHADWKRIWPELIKQVA